MENEGSFLPQNRWRLTAPESYVLLYGPKSGGSALKLALLELVARECLELVEAEERGAFGRTKRVAILRHGSGKRDPGGPPLDALVELLGSVQTEASEDGSGGVPVAELARAARKRYGRLAGYAEAEVLASLMRRGLYERWEQRFLGIFRYTRWEPTRAGVEARAELERNMSLGEERFGQWVDGDPAQALAFLGVAGSSVLLMSPLHPDIRRLHELHRAEGADAASVGVYPIIGNVSNNYDLGDEPGNLLGGFDFGAFDLDLSVFDALDSVFSAIDSGVDSSGGDGGWGGGGSDGGAGEDGGGSGG
jgi:hypothetical protein